jgi:hypothetical protein
MEEVWVDTAVMVEVWVDMAESDSVEVWVVMEEVSVAVMED